MSLSAVRKILRETGVSDALVRRLVEHAEHADDPRLHRISAFRMADEWGLERGEVLDAFLFGARVGVFDVMWSNKCPSCKGPTTSEAQLSEIRANAHCAYCRIDYSSGFDTNVEVTFSLNPNVRSTRDVNPIEVMTSWTEFLDASSIFVGVGETVEVERDCIEAAWHLYEHGFAVSAPLQISASAEDSHRVVDYVFDGQNLTRTTEARRPGRLRLRIRNDGDRSLDLHFARKRRYPWVNAADVASRQVFRDHFRTELLAEDQTFKVESVVLMFTDVKGSTDLYERRGDSTAYYLVREHFRVLTDAIRRNNGAIVKTIGDAVMATFRVSTEGVRAAFEAHEAFAAFNREQSELGPEDAFSIKVGLHRGGCIAVTSNDTIDYFGRTVNLAARIQGLSRGGDLVLSRSLYEEDAVSDLVASHCTTGAWHALPDSAHLKGIQGEFEVTRVTMEP